MEASEISEEVFDSYNLNPRLFINEVLNSIDDLVDGAFEFFSQRAAEIGGVDTDKREELSRGVSILHNIAQAVLDERLNIWEKYCLQHIFRVPEGFSIQETVISGSSSILQDALCDSELDNQLETLRDKLSAAEMESLKLKKEIQMYENQSVSMNECERVINEATKLHEKILMQELFGEVKRMVPILHNKFKKLRDSIDVEKPQLTRRCKSHHVNHNAGFSPKLDDLQQAFSFIKKVEARESAI